MHKILVSGVSEEKIGFNRGWNAEKKCVAKGVRQIIR